MSITFNEFQRELNKRISDPNVAYMLSLMFEMNQATLQQLNTCADVVNSLVETVGNVVELHHTTQHAVKQMNKKINGDVEGVHVSTEPGKGTLDG